MKWTRVNYIILTQKMEQVQDLVYIWLLGLPIEGVDVQEMTDLGRVSGACICEVYWDSIRNGSGIG